MRHLDCIYILRTVVINFAMLRWYGLTGFKTWELAESFSELQTEHDVLVLVFFS